MPKRGVMLMRVSGREQEKEATIDTQRYWLLDYCERHDIVVVDEYPDEAVDSWIPVQNRPHGARLWRAVPTGAFDVVLVFMIDRLSRYRPVSDPFLDYLQHHNIQFLCINSDVNRESEGGKLKYGIEMLFGEHERDMITKRTTAGRYQTAALGGYCGGVVPYGYHVVGTKPRFLEPDEEERPIVVLIYDWCVTFRWSTCQIAAELNARGVPTATADRRPGRRHNPHAKGHWSPEVINQILRNTLYKGERYYGKRPAAPRDPLLQQQAPPEGVDPRRFYRKKQKAAPQERWLLQRVIPLVDVPTWEMAQERLHENRKHWPRPAKANIYALGGLVLCGRCGHRYTGTTQRSRGKLFGYYICTGRHLARRSFGPDAPACCNPTVSQKTIEERVWHVVRGHLNNVEETLEELRQRRGNEQEQQERLLTRLDALRAEEVVNATAKTNYLKILARNPGTVSEDEEQRQLAEYRSIAGNLGRRIYETEQELVALQKQGRRMDDAATFLREWHEQLHEEWTPEERKACFRQFVEQVKISEEDGRIALDITLTFAPPQSSTDHVVMSRKQECWKIHRAVELAAC